MNHTTVINKISDLGYKGFKEAYLRQLEDVNYHNLSFEDRLYQLLDAQDIFLNNRRIQMNLKLSKIKNKQALIENIDYDPKREINKAQILSLSSMDFIRSHQNVIINGKAGTGKSSMAQAFGIRAIQNGFTVYYIRTATSSIKSILDKKLYLQKPANNNVASIHIFNNHEYLRGNIYQ